MSERKEREEVVRAAVAYVRELENPAPDLNHRLRLRARLIDAVHAYRSGEKQ